MSSAPANALFRPRLGRRRALGALFVAACILAASTSLLALAALLTQVVRDGWRFLSFGFLNRFPSVLEPETAGIKAALWGSVWVLGLTVLIAVPIAVAAGVFLYEYARRNPLTRWIELNIANLAGVPAIVYGMLGLSLFVRWLEFDRSVLSAALTMSLLSLPVIIIATRQALAAVPNSLRDAAFALGATRWQVVWAHVLPAALPGILTGAILALSRAAGEAAPLVLLGAATWVAATPDGLFSSFSVLPIQIYGWTDQAQEEFHHLAASGIIVLLGLIFLMNFTCVLLRAWGQRKRLT